MAAATLRFLSWTASWSCDGQAVRHRGAAGTDAPGETASSGFGPRAQHAGHGLRAVAVPHGGRHLVGVGDGHVIVSCCNMGIFDKIEQLVLNTVTPGGGIPLNQAGPAPPMPPPAPTDRKVHIIENAKIKVRGWLGLRRDFQPK